MTHRFDKELIAGNCYKSERWIDGILHHLRLCEVIGSIHIRIWQSESDSRYSESDRWTCLVGDCDSPTNGFEPADFDVFTNHIVVYS